MPFELMSLDELPTLAEVTEPRSRRSRTVTLPCATLTGLALTAFCRPVESAKLAYAKPLRLSISTYDTAPNGVKAWTRSGSVMPWLGFACFRKA